VNYNKTKETYAKFLYRIERTFI